MSRIVGRRARRGSEAVYTVAVSRAVLATNADVVRGIVRDLALPHVLAPGPDADPRWYRVRRLDDPLLETGETSDDFIRDTLTVRVSTRWRSVFIGRSNRPARRH